MLSEDMRRDTTLISSLFAYAIVALSMEDATPVEDMGEDNAS
jgi:hypothetical protein